MIRTINAYLLIVPMRVTGLRFSKDYRWGTSRWHRAIYRMVDTVYANVLTGPYDMPLMPR